MNKNDTLAAYSDFTKWCRDNPHLDLDSRPHSHGGPIGDGGYISDEKTRVAFAAWRAAIEADRQARGEPVAWAELHPRTGDVCDFIRKDEAYRLDEIKPEYVLPLYAAPQPQQQATKSRQDSHDNGDPSGADGYAYRYRHINGGTVLRFNHGEEVNGSKPIEAVPFWFKPQSPQIPEGYKLVPIEPTEEMHAAAVRTLVRCQGNDDFPPRVYKAMLEAAPDTSRDSDGNHPTRRNPDAL